MYNISALMLFTPMNLGSLDDYDPEKKYFDEKYYDIFVGIKDTIGIDRYA